MPRTSGSVTLTDEYARYPTLPNSTPGRRQQGGPPLPVARNTWARACCRSTPRLRDSDV